MKTRNFFQGTHQKILKKSSKKERFVGETIESFRQIISGEGKTFLSGKDLLHTVKNN